MMDDEKYDYLSELVMHYVLPLLPAEDLLRWRSVSLRWNERISSDLFVQTHAALSRSVSGVFHSFAADAVYVPFHRPLSVPPLSFLPERATVESSARGLLCCRGLRSLRLYVCNPLTAEWALIPPPINREADDPVAVLVPVEPWPWNFDADYHLVVLHVIGDTGAYWIETFSSIRWEWTASVFSPPAGGAILPGSGVAAGGAAHWRTTEGTVVSYSPEGHTWREEEGPGEAERWVLGEVEGRLSCACVEGERAVVRVLDWERRRWEVAMSVAGDWCASATPARSQGAREVIFLVEMEGYSVTRWEVVALDLDGAEERRLPVSVPVTELVPYVSSFVGVKSGPPDYNDERASFSLSLKLTNMDEVDEDDEGPEGDAKDEGSRITSSS